MGNTTRHLVPAAGVLLAAVLIWLGGCNAPVGGGASGGSGGETDGRTDGSELDSAEAEPGSPLPGEGDEAAMPFPGSSTPGPGEGEDGLEAGVPVPPGLDGSDPGGADGGTEPETGAPGADEEAQAGMLTAGSFDDNLNYGVFEEFASQQLLEDLFGSPPEFSVGRRVVVTVRNDIGRPVGDARVVVSAAPDAEALLEVTTGSDGRVLFATGLDGGTEAVELTLTVYPPDGSPPNTETVSNEEPAWGVVLGEIEAGLPGQLDLAFVVDATGSMADEMSYLKSEVDSIAITVAEQFPEVDQRYALIVYRDQGDAYLTRTFDFTASLSEFQADLAEQQATGGGDYPEAMHLALEEASALSWRQEGTARVLFLIADAPPHNEFALRTVEAINALRLEQIAIYPIAASSVAEQAELIMRAAALLTMSQYLFLTDDSGVGNPHAEPHIPCYVVENLNVVMGRMIATELAGRRIEADPEDIIRVVGNPVNGICEKPDPGQEGDQNEGDEG